MVCLLSQASWRRQSHCWRCLPEPHMTACATPRQQEPCFIRSTPRPPSSAPKIHLLKDISLSWWGGVCQRELLCRWSLFNLELVGFRIRKTLWHGGIIYEPDPKCTCVYSLPLCSWSPWPLVSVFSYKHKYSRAYHGQLGLYESLRRGGGFSKWPYVVRMKLLTFWEEPLGRQSYQHGSSSLLTFFTA